MTPQEVINKFMNKFLAFTLKGQNLDTNQVSVSCAWKSKLSQSESVFCFSKDTNTLRFCCEENAKCISY